MFDLMISLIIIFLIIPFIISTIMTIWVYRDAKNRNLNIFAWILIIWLIPFFFGLITYILIREKYKPERD